MGSAAQKAIGCLTAPTDWAERLAADSGTEAGRACLGKTEGSNHRWTQIRTDKAEMSLRGGCGMALSIKALVETGNGGLHGGDLRFDQLEAAGQVIDDGARMKGGQDFGAGKIGQITGPAGLAGFFQAAIFVLGDAKDDNRDAQ